MRTIDLYPRGAGSYFQITAADLLITLERGATVTSAKAAQMHDDGQDDREESERLRRVCALIAWLRGLEGQ